MKHVIDAQGKKLGRVASEAARLLMGKNSPEYVRNTAPEVSVVIDNASKLSLDEKKKTQKIYRHHSGFPGGLKESSLALLIEKKGTSEALKKAIYGMLPTNKLRKIMMKNLKVNE